MKNFTILNPATDNKKIMEDRTDNSYIVEIAAEVCYKMGGINTVIVSKVATMVDKWRDKYFLVGPYLPIDYSGVFKPAEEEDYKSAIGLTVLKLRKMKINIHFGFWLIPGAPRVVLLDPYQSLSNIQELKENYFNFYGVETPKEMSIYDKFIIFGYLVEKFLAEFKQNIKNDIVAHFHEFNSSCAILEICRKKLEISTVFTTHATVLGRYLAENDKDYHKSILTNKLFPKDYELDPFTRFGSQLEALLVQSADIFTTVSELTARECNLLLGKKPDVITPNGFDLEAPGLKAINSTNPGKKKLNAFLNKHFNKRDRIDTDNSLIFFTAGRHEFKNKGYDLIIKSLAEVNKRILAEKLNLMVIMFFIIDAPSKSYTRTTFRIANAFDKLKSFVKKSKELVGMHKTEILTQSLLFRKGELILNELKKNGLKNRKKDRVKVVYHPEFISPDCTGLNMEYFDFLKGCDLGIFPSYYEPWGYTPVECLAHGIPAITSDMTGFGQSVLNDAVMEGENGIHIINRSHGNFDKSAEELTNVLMEVIRQKGFENKVSNKFSTYLSWKNMIQHYESAYAQAIDVKYPTNV